MEKHVVMSDLHGQADLLRKVVDYYGNDVIYDDNGDKFDRCDKVKELIDLEIEIGANSIRGNHEWITEAALSDIDPERRTAWQEYWLQKNPGLLRVEAFTLESYGVERYPRHADTARAFKDRLQSLGHWAYLQTSQMYIETDDMFIVHAGLNKNKSMSVHYRELDVWQARAIAHDFTDEPDYVGEHKFSNEIVRPDDLSKTLITGHSHTSSKAQRIFPGNDERPDRVLLSSNLAIGAPLYVYENWTGQVREFNQD